MGTIFILISFSIYAQEKMKKEQDKITKIAVFDERRKALLRFYRDCLENQNFDKNQAQIVDFVIKISTQQELEGNQVQAFFLVQDAYQNLSKFITDPESNKQLVYYLSYYLMLVHEQKQAIKLLTESIHPQKITALDIGSIILLTKLYNQSGRFQESIDWSEKALFFLNYDKKNKNFIGLMTNKINAYVELNNHIEVLKNSQKISQLVGSNPFFSSHYYTNLGLSFRNQQKYDEAIRYFSKSRRYQQDEESKLLVDDLNIAKVYQLKGAFEKSIKLCDKIIENLNRINPNLRSIEVSSLYQTQANNYYQLNDFLKGEAYHSKALRILNFKGTLRTFHGNYTLLLDVILEKVKYLTKFGKNGITTIYQADSLIDIMRQEHTELGSKLFWREHTHNFYENAIETCFKLKNHNTAFYFMEKSRAILLLDALKDLDAKKILSEEKLSQEQSLRYKIIGLQNQLENTPESDKNYTKIYQQLINVKEVYNGFVQSLEKTNNEYYQLKYQNRYISLSYLRSGLKSNQSFVEYFVGEKAVYAFLVTAKDTRMIKINLTQFQSISKQFLLLSARKPPHTSTQLHEFYRVSNQLYQLIFAPLNIPLGRVIISQDNYFLPFSSLVTNIQQKKYLIEDYAFSYSYSANILFRDRVTYPSFNNSLLGFAPVHFNISHKLNSLDGSENVLKGIEEKYFSGKVFFEQQATKQIFIKNAPNFQIIQLFTHGKADTISDKSKIYFYDDALDMRELYQLGKLKADLVVLSACETNLGSNATGEGIMSFARGFAYLGVPSTISTLWRVNNQSTYQLTESFYKYLDDGYEKDIALQKAQQDYLKTSGYQFPYYWSGMVLVGDSNNMKEYSHFFILIIIIVLCTLILYLT